MRAILLLAVAGCGDGTEPPTDRAIVLADENNYSYVGHVNLGNVEVGAAADADVDWSALATDLQGHPVDPAADVDEIVLTRFADGLDEEALEQLIADSQLLQEHIQAAFLYENAGDVTAVRLVDFELFGNVFVPEEYFLDDGGVWGISLFTDGIAGPRMSTFLTASAASDNHRIEIRDDSSALEFSANLTDLAQIEVAAGQPTSLDWSGLTVNGLGEPIDFDRVEELLLGRFEDMTPADLESQILDLETLAAEKYSADLGTSTSIDPTTAVDAAGTPFSGFGAGELWIVVLRCSVDDCTNPAPAFLGIVHVE